MIKKWIKSTDGLAGIEAALIFPILLLLLIGTFDIGNAVLAKQKTLRASQITADLVTREKTVTDALLNDFYQAGRISLEPFNNQDYGVDIISVEFDNNGDASILWRNTYNMDPIDNALSSVEPLAEPNSGIVIVVSNYIYDPVFPDVAMVSLKIVEKSFATGRKSSTVTKE